MLLDGPRQGYGGRLVLRAADYGLGRMVGVLGHDDRAAGSLLLIARAFYVIAGDAAEPANPDQNVGQPGFEFQHQPFDGQDNLSSHDPTTYRPATTWRRIAKRQTA